VAQDEGPEFKPKHHKKKIRKLQRFLESLWLSSHSISQLPLHLLGECQRKGLVISLCFVCLWKD
jgi:hypothetical protein